MQNKRPQKKEKENSVDIWRVVCGHDIVIRYLDGDFIVFSSLSGETHLLDIVSGRVLKRTTEGPVSVFDIQSEIADFLEIEDQEGLANAIEEILSRLEDAELVEIDT